MFLVFVSTAPAPHFLYCKVVSGLWQYWQFSSVHFSKNQGVKSAPCPGRGEGWWKDNTLCWRVTGGGTWHFVLTIMLFNISRLKIIIRKVYRRQLNQWIGHFQLHQILRLHFKHYVHSSKCKVRRPNQIKQPAQHLAAHLIPAHW